jgi:hypothetical protein
VSAFQSGLEVHLGAVENVVGVAALVGEPEHEVGDEVGGGRLDRGCAADGAGVLGSPLEEVELDGGQAASDAVLIRLRVLGLCHIGKLAADRFAARGGHREPAVGDAREERGTTARFVGRSSWSATRQHIARVVEFEAETLCAFLQNESCRSARTDVFHDIRSEFGDGQLRDVGKLPDVPCVQLQSDSPSEAGESSGSRLEGQHARLAKAVVWCNPHGNFLPLHHLMHWKRCVR